VGVWFVGASWVAWVDGGMGAGCEAVTGGP
jgi:hypothetical protein